MKRAHPAPQSRALAREDTWNQEPRVLSYPRSLRLGLLPRNEAAIASEAFFPPFELLDKEQAMLLDRCCMGRVSSQIAFLIEVFFKVKELFRASHTTKHP